MPSKLITAATAVAASAVSKAIGGRDPLGVYELGRGPLGGSPRATAPYDGPRPGTIGEG
jgi:hypothetical protein